MSPSLRTEGLSSLFYQVGKKVLDQDRTQLLVKSIWIFS